METALLAAQLVATGLITGWITLGVRDNLIHPQVNETYTAEVMEMTRMRTEYPEAYAAVAHRAVTDRGAQVIAFRLVVAVELLSAILLWIGVGGLALALFGLGGGPVMALVGTTVFTAVWGGFLVVGNHFCYWFCHQEAQNTHFQMTLWGLVTMVLLAMG